MVMEKRKTKKACERKKEEEEEGDSGESRVEKEELR